ncbi:SIMPL domain-containing protein [Sedimenticola thiotaurini]|uniref:DUF541 domain-containing protein n=1 Tax=Sedimenticola thiotaurini TaxID=1543721 RepID=A0A0F7JXM4_9GAMM|nr:SIMPL domain-containing protein [Sedimenticola thiotaurini]AKH21226.1 hypothetical protein AAY24_13600 [Sedimenticola thiotaurini]
MNFRFLALLLTLIAGPAFGDQPALTYDRINLAVSAGEEVDNDTLSATLFAQQEGKDPAELGKRVNSAIKQAVESAKQHAGIKVQTLDYQTTPIYRNNTLTAWRVRQSIRLESRDAALIAQLIGQLQSGLSIGSISYDVSPEQRQQLEARLISRAIQLFRERASLISQEMGHSHYRLVQMDINTGGVSPRPYPMRTMALKAESAPTLEAGTQRLEVHINGTIELKTE